MIEIFSQELYAENLQELFTQDNKGVYISSSQANLS